jgi:hypothetical protein
MSKIVPQEDLPTGNIVPDEDLPANDTEYQQYLRQYDEEKTRPQIPGAVVSDPLSEKDFKIEQARKTIPGKLGKAAGVVIGGTPEFLAMTGSFLSAGLTAPFYAAMSSAANKDIRRFFPAYQEWLDKATYKPQTEAGQELTHSLMPILGALPPVGGYLPVLSGTRKQPSKELKPSVDFTKLDETKAVPAEDLPMWKDRAEAMMRDDQTVNRLEAAIAKQNPRQPTIPMGMAEPMPMRVTPEGQAFTPESSTNFWQDRAQGMTDAAQAEINFWKDRAKRLELDAQAAEAPPNILRAQQETPFVPEPLVGDVPSMEAMARAQEGITRNQVPPDAVIPRDAQFFQGERDKPMLRTPRGNEWRVDENGMPVRQGLPETTVDPAYLQRYMRPDEQARNDLGNAIQEANGPQLAPGGEIGSESLSGPFEGPGPAGRQPRGGVGPGNTLGRGGGPTRGAINPNIFSDTYQKVKELGNGLKMVLQGHPESPTITMYLNDEKIGSSLFNRTKYYGSIADPQDLQPKWVHVLPEHQKKGLAKEMYKFAAEVGNDIVPDDVQTESGRKLWDSLEKDGTAVYNDWERPNKKIPAQTLEPWGFSGTGRSPQRGALNIRSGKNEIMKRIEEAIKTPLRTAPPTSQDIISEALAEGKDGKGTINFSAGATLEASKRNSALIRGVGRTVQYFRNIGESAIKDSVFPFEESVRFLKINKQETVNLAEILKKEMFNKERWETKALADAGASEKVLLARQKYIDMQQAALDAQNKARAARGEKPITAMDSYMSSRWQGDFRRSFVDAEGRTRWFLAADTMRSLEADTQALLKAHPDLVKGQDYTVKSLKGRGVEYAQVYTRMLDVLGDDPAFQKVKAWAEDQAKLEAEGMLGQTKHFEPKGNIRGFVGDRPWKDPYKEATAMLQQQAQYAKNAHRWSAMQEAQQSLKEVFSSKELSEQQPRNMNHAKQYFLNQIGASELPWIKGLEDAIRSKGVSPTKIFDNVNTVKSLWVAQKIGVNLGFATMNAVQLINGLPHVADIQMKYGGNPLVSFSLGPVFGLGMVMGHQVSNKYNIYKPIANLPKDMKLLGIDHTFIAQAMKYAEDNHVISKSIYDESPIENSFGLTGRAERAANIAEKIVNKSIALPDSLRAMAYMTYAVQLKTSGKFKDNLEVLRLADEYTRQSMADYNTGEKAIIFDKLGNLGNAANILQTYPINFYNQWSWAAREMVRKNPLPFVTMLLVQGYVAGAMGFPGFSDLDKAFEWTKDKIKEEYPEFWAKIRNWNLKDAVIALGDQVSMGEELLGGKFSKDTGIAFTSRAAAPTASDMITVPGGPIGDIGIMGKSLFDLALDPSDKQKAAQAAYNMSFVGLQGLLETTVLRDQVSTPGPEGQVYRKTTDMSDRKGMYERSPEEESLRKLGFRSQREAFVREQNYRMEKRTQDAKTVAAGLPDRIYNELRKGDAEKAAELTKLYAELSQTVNQRDFGRVMDEMIKSRVEREILTPDKRVGSKRVTTAEELIAYKRYKEIMKEAGYAN